MGPWVVQNLKISMLTHFERMNIGSFCFRVGMVHVKTTKLVESKILGCRFVSHLTSLSQF